MQIYRRENIIVMFKQFIFAAFVSTTVVAVKWEDCGSKVGVVKSVNVPSCPGTGDCPLKRGTQAEVQIDFTSKEVTPAVTAVVHGIIAGIHIPFPISDPNACEKCGLVCPLKSGTSYPYKTLIDVKSSYPPVEVIVQWELKDSNMNDLACIKIPAKIV